MALSIPTITLNDGRAMPLLGLGTYKSTEKEAEKAIVTAAKYGYRLIDTASSYKNEDSIGRGIRASGIPRENFFITTKVWNTAQRVGDIEGAFNRSLDRLRLDYVDLYLIHWPVPGCYPETWRALEKIRESGRAKSIGVSNFEEPHLTALFEFSGVIRNTAFDCDCITVSVIGCICDFIAGNALYNFSIQPDHEMTACLGLVRLFQPCEIIPVLDGSRSRIGRVMNDNSTTLFKCKPRTGIFIDRKQFHV